MVLTEEHINRIKRVIYDEVHGREFYTDEMFQDTTNAISRLINDKISISINDTQSEIIEKIKTFMMTKCRNRQEYIDYYLNSKQLPKSELQYRTAYATLLKEQSVCPGIAEATRILLECYGINTHTIFAKLPEYDKQIPHFICVAEISDNVSKFFKLVDPEREDSCNQKNIDYQKYKGEMKFFKPPQIYFNRKLDNFGVGPLVSEIFARDILFIDGDENIEKLFEVKERFEKE